jgi:predicted RNase H-like nuclease (RuvC/YqgF family)
MSEPLEELTQVLKETREMLARLSRENRELREKLEGSQRELERLKRPLPRKTSPESRESVSLSQAVESLKDSRQATELAVETIIESRRRGLL